MSFDTDVEKYLRSMQKEYIAARRGGQHTAELSFRNPMHMLFQDISHTISPDTNFDIILEPRNQGRMGRPDWRIQNHDSLGVYGYIEAKGPTAEHFDISPYKSQIDKYLSLGHKLIITDGIEFIFCFDKNPVAIELFDKNSMNTDDWTRLAVDYRFKFYMEKFFVNPAPQQLDENHLVELVAVRTRNLADDILRYADLSPDEAIDEDERQVISLLSGLKEIVYNHNDSSLRKGKVFADFTAQVVMFCLLYAHRVFCLSADSAIEKERKIKNYVYGNITEGESMLPFRRLMLYLRDNADSGAYICRWVDECISFLSYVQMTNWQLLNPDYHRLFEIFLSKYDAQSRFDYGAYYTPKILADFVVGLTNRIITDTFNGASIYSDGNYIIDPCCGTGAFLESFVEHDEHDGAYNLCGFEILPAPYMLANYRMSLLARQRRSNNRHITNILLANTLSNCVFGEEANENSIEGQELSLANRLSNMPLKLIISNPPCSDSRRGKVTEEFSVINELMEDFRPPTFERRPRQNIQKQINNSFMQFIRWSCKKLLDCKNHSVLSLVVPLSFLEGESYKYARKYLTEHFSSIWAIVVDADARTGVRSDSLFHTLQGRAVIILTRKYGETANIQHFKFIDFSHGSRREKEELLGYDIDKILEMFVEYSISANTYALMPTRPFNENLYEKFWPISDSNNGKAIFMNQCSGSKMAPTALLTHVNAALLKRRSREIREGGVNVANQWIGQQDKKVPESKIRAFCQALSSLPESISLENLLTDSIRPCSFRPYVNSNVLLCDSIFSHLARVGGGGTRIRPEIRRMYDTEGTIGFSLSHAPKDLDESLGQFVSFCWYFPDNDLSRRGNGHIYLNQYVDSNGRNVITNISEDILENLAKETNLPRFECSRKVVFYCYAILCSQVYLDEFYGALFVVNQSDRRARIPIVKDVETFLNVADIGESIAMLERKDFCVENVLSFNYEEIIKKLPKGFKLEHSKSAARNPFDEENEKLNLRDELSGHVLSIDCPVALQNFTVSGYNVVKDCWLKFHSYRYTHCDFMASDLKELLDLLNILQVQTLYVAKIDEIVHRIIDGQIHLLSPV